MSTKHKQNTDVYSLDHLSITNDAYVGRVFKKPGKYDAFFSRLQIGQRLVCLPQGSARIASSLKKWLIQHGHKNPVVKSVAHCHDGKGGVWWISEEKAPIKTTLAPGAAWPHVAKKGGAAK